MFIKCNICFRVNKSILVVLKIECFSLFSFLRSGNYINIQRYFTCNVFLQIKSIKVAFGNTKNIKERKHS